MSGNAADIAQTAWISSLEARLDALWAWVVSIAAFVWGVLVVIYNTFVAWATPIIVFLQGAVAWLTSIYNTFLLPVLTWLNTMYTTYVLPVLTWLQGLVFWLQSIVLLIQGKLEELVNFVYNKVFKDVEELRKNIIEVFNTLKDVVSVFSRELADRIQVTEDKFLRLLDSMSRDLRDQFLSTLHDVTDPVIHKLNELDIVLDRFIGYVQDYHKKLDIFISATFEKPQLLRKETMRATGLLYGMDLWEATFEGSTPSLTEEEAKPFPFARIPEWMQKTQENIIKGKEGEWSDVEKRIEEELSEIITGEPVEKYTDIVPAVPA